MSEWDQLSRAGRPRWQAIFGWVAVVSMLALAALAPSATLAKDTPGNNGTVKIHEGATETEPIVRNEPHVCTFHLHFFFADDEQTGTWEIQEWAPGDKGVVVLSGTYDTRGDGEDRQPEQGAYELPDGHYKLFWDGDLDTDKHDKHKVFWVDCEEAAPSGSTAPIETTTPSQSVAPSGSVAPTETASASPSGEVEGIVGTPQPTGEVEGIVGTPRPTGEVEGIVGTPSTTLPPTDVEGATTPADQSWRSLLVVMGALLAAILVITPSPAARRR